MKPLSIYFHWPYCKSKCPYCDFFKIVQKNTDQAAVIDAYIKELDYYRDLLPDYYIQSVFFGGGTPSLLDPLYVERLIDYIVNLWNVTKNVEITLEANPNSNRDHMFSDLKLAGINRLSLGVQALNDKDLKFLGRTHNLSDAYRSIEDVLAVFDNHSMDLIYARPNQRLDNWFCELGEAVHFGFKHLSLYQLTIEQGTVFDKKGVKALEDEKAAEMYLKTVDFLRDNGYPRYEVSNFSPARYESVHNKCYWQGDEYIGIGESAHGRFCLNGEHYAAVHPHRFEILSPKERAEELVIMGLRLQKGIEKQHFKDICGIDFDCFIHQEKLQDMISAGLLVNKADYVFATDEGFIVLDKIIENLCV